MTFLWNLNDHDLYLKELSVCKNKVLKRSKLKEVILIMYGVREIKL